MFEEFINKNYKKLLQNSVKYCGNQEKGMDVLHFVIDYYYRKDKISILESVIKVSDIEAIRYINKSLYINAHSKTAPYKQYMNTGNVCSLNDFYDNYAEEHDVIINDNLIYDLTEIKNDVILTLLKHPFVICQFSSEQYESAMTIFLIIYHHGLTMKKIAMITGIPESRIRKHFNTLKDLLHKIVNDKELICLLIPNYSLFFI